MKPPDTIRSKKNIPCNEYAHHNKYSKKKTFPFFIKTKSRIEAVQERQRDRNY